MSTTDPVTSKSGESGSASAAALIEALGNPLEAAVAAVAAPTLMAAIRDPQDGKAAAVATRFDKAMALAGPLAKRVKWEAGASLLTGFENAGEGEAVKELALTAEEEVLLHSMFNRWALDNRICLIDLFGSDLFDEIDQTVSDSDVKEKLKNDFARLFVISYMCGQLMPSMQSMFPDVTLTRDFFQPADKWCERFQKMKKQLEEVYQAQLGKKGGLARGSLRVRQEIQQNVLAKMELFLKFWRQPNFTLFLLDMSLLKFKGTAVLNKGDPKHTLSHLVKHLNSLLYGLRGGRDIRMLGIEFKSFEVLKTALEKLSLNPSSVEAFQAVRSCLINELGDSYTKFGDLFNQAKEAAAGRLTHGEFCRRSKVKNTTHWSQDQFTSQLISHVSQCHFMNALANECFRIFEWRIAPLLFPSIPSLYALFIRINWLVAADLSGHFKLAPPLPSPNQSKGAAYPFLDPLCLDVNQMISELCIPLHSELVSSKEYEALLNAFRYCDKGEVIYTNWVPLFKSCEPILDKFNARLSLLDTVREKVLNHIMGSLKTMPLAELKEHGGRYIEAFRASCFRFLRPLCAQTIIFKDIENFLSCKIPSSLDDYLYLIPPELANLMQLEGIEERLEALIAEKQKAADALLPPPAPEAEPAPVAAEAAKPAPAPKAEPAPVAAEAAKPAPAAKAEAAKPAAAPQKAPLKLSPAERFRLRSGMNIRTVLRMLKEEGFLPLSQTGSHVKFKKAGGGEVIVPLHKELKPGTLKGIEEQVEDAKAPKKDK